MDKQKRLKKKIDLMCCTHRLVLSIEQHIVILLVLMLLMMMVVVVMV